MARGVRFEQVMVDPGPDFSKTPAQTVEVLQALPALHALGRPVLLAVSRKDFVGALTGRAPRARLAGTLAALAHGVDAGAHVLRIHDVADAADYLRGPGGAGVRRRAGLRAADRRPGALGPGRIRHADALDSGPRIAGRWPNATGAHRSQAKGVTMSVLDRSALEASPLADLHAIASELSIDGYRRLRRADLINASWTSRRAARIGRRPTMRRRPPRRSRLRRPPRSRSPRPWKRPPRPWKRPPRPRRRPPRPPRIAPTKTTMSRRRPAAAEAAAAAAGGEPPARTATRPTGTRRPTPRWSTRPAPGTTSPRRRPATARSRWRARSSCWPTAPGSSASAHPIPPTTTSTSPRPRSSAASWSPATGLPAPSGRPAGPSASRR